MKQKFAREVQDMKDRIHVLKLGKEQASNEIMEIKKELRDEDKRIEVYLERDREKLKYAQDMLQTRHLVLMSFRKEYQRQLALLNPDLPERQILDEKMEMGRSELQRIQNLRERQAGQKEKKAPRKKVKSIGRDKVSESSKMSGVPNYNNVRSRLFQSIEASRLKEQKKFVDPNVNKLMHLKDKEKGRKHYTTAHTGHDVDEKGSVVTSQSMTKKKFFSHSKPAMMKTENGSVRNSNAKSKQLAMSNSGGDMPAHYDTNQKQPQGSHIGFNAPPDLGHGGVSRRKTVMFRQSHQDKENHIDDAQAVYRSLSNAERIDEQD